MLDYRCHTTRGRCGSFDKQFFAPAFKNTCENHGGSGLAAVQQWDAKAKKWNMITEYMYGDSDVVQKLIAEDSSKYAAEQKIAERCN